MKLVAEKQSENMITSYPLRFASFPLLSIVNAAQAPTKNNCSILFFSGRSQL